jgi:hypothetical protein
LLQGLSHVGLPVFDEVTVLDGARFTLRRYIEGEPLNEIFKSEKNDEKILDIFLQLCAILEFLHSRGIIHRDIKPSNIIYNKKTNVATLIDFGISRRFNEAAENDTVYFVTQKFAPPEQYGFSQTDARSDIFSLGMVLRFWLTGTTDRKAKISNPRLAKIVAKCTAFEPDRRFQTAEKLKNSLLRYKNHAKRRFLTVACFLAACLIALFVVFAKPSPDTEITPFFEVTDEMFYEFIYHRGFPDYPVRTNYLRVAGSPVLSLAENGGVSVSGRQNNWYCFDLFVYSFPPGDYVLVVEFYSHDPLAIFEFGLTEGPPWGVFASTTENTLRHEITLVAHGEESRASVICSVGNHVYLRRIRLQTNQIGTYVPHPDFTVRSIKLYKN